MTGIKKETAKVYQSAKRTHTITPTLDANFGKSSQLECNQGTVISGMLPRYCREIAPFLNFTS
jgi:hypothetical protein